MKKLKIQKIALDVSSVDQFKRLDKDYWIKPQLFDNLISHLPNEKGIQDAIHDNQKNFDKRKEISSILRNQYHDINDQLIHAQINKLENENCFVILCAHQPVLLGGPLYWWYKICNTISLCNTLNAKYSTYHFVPMYYCGCEDHDFEECNHIHLFGKKYEWSSSETGACGRMKTEGIEKIIKDFMPLFQNHEFALKFLNQILEYAKSSKSYADFYRKFVHSIFGRFGLIQFNPDDSAAKQLLIPYLKQELIFHTIQSNSSESENVLNSLKYTSQAYIRPINIFYLRDQYRIGIEMDNELYKTRDGKFVWSKDEISLEIETNPERFSPNVVLRPIYQQLLFPAVIFIGGGAEINYWLQLKSVFNHWKIYFPILWRRISGIIFSSAQNSRMKKLQLTIHDFLQSSTVIKNKFLGDHSELLIKLNESHQLILEAMNKHKQYGEYFDNSFQASLNSEMVKIEHALEKVTQKLVKQEKQKHEEDLNKIDKIKEGLFPEGALQERLESGLQHLLQNGPEFIDAILDHYEIEDQFNAYLIEH